MHNNCKSYANISFKYLMHSSILNDVTDTDFLIPWQNLAKSWIYLKHLGFHKIFSHDLDGSVTSQSGETRTWNHMKAEALGRCWTSSQVSEGQLRPKGLDYDGTLDSNVWALGIFQSHQMCTNEDNWTPWQLFLLILCGEILALFVLTINRRNTESDWNLSP